MSVTARWRYIVDPAGKYGIYPEGGKFVAIVDGEEAARRIVRAVNAHDALVQVLRDVLDHVEDSRVPRIGNQCTLCHTYREKIRAAIRLADGAIVETPPDDDAICAECGKQHDQHYGFLMAKDRRISVCEPGQYRRRFRAATGEE